MKYAIISMDVEDWYHTYFSNIDVDRSISVLDGIDVLLDILSKEGIKGSFFVVGELMDALSDKLIEMDRFGHDIACHNQYHVHPMSISVEEYRNQLEESKRKLEEILGHKVSGYRAPSFGIDSDRFNTIINCGFSYDSSWIKKQISKKYGSLSMKGMPEVFPGVFQCGSLTEFEVSTYKVGSLNILLGGGYLRMLPWFFIRTLIKRYLRTGKLYVMYIHPIDLTIKKIPKFNGITIDRFLRTHIGRKYMTKRFQRIISMIKKEGYEFVTFEKLLKILSVHDSTVV